MEAKTQVIRALTKQANLKRQVIAHAIKVKRAMHAAEQFSYAGRFSYSLSTTGSDISLTFFHPKETKAGVSAKPRGRQSALLPALLPTGDRSRSASVRS